MNIAARIVAAVATCAISAVYADAPQFDRPGIAFAPSTVPSGAMSFEQGLPDFERSSADGVRTTSYAADTNVRIGITDALEVQFGTSLLNYSTMRGPQASATSHGSGDSNIAFKVALPSPSSRFSWATLGSISFATGDRDFTAGARQYDWGTTAGVQLTDQAATALYVDINRFHASTSYTLSPSFSYAVSERVGAFVEAGATYSRHNADVVVTGGGVTWMLTPIVQLDLAADFGVSHAAPHLQGGFGVSVFVN